jgi:ketosteroid isomerase-like protein
MGRWSREELESAFANFQRVLGEAGVSGDWSKWAELYTEDASYFEHNFGSFEGRPAIRRWVEGVMRKPPNTEMTEFPVDWSIIDEERGWIVFRIWNRMRDPGDGSVHQEANFTLLKYAGDGRFSYQEDIYNPARVEVMIKGYLARVEELARQRGA